MKTIHNLATHISTLSPRQRLLSSGFTLAELMVVIAIAGIVAAIAIPNLFQWKRNAAYRNSVIRIRAELAHTKMLALETGHQVRFEVCEDAANSYQIAEGDQASSSDYLHANCPMSDNDPASEAQAYRDASRYVKIGDLTDFPGVTLQSTSSGKTLIFNPKGLIDSTTRTYNISDGTNSQDISIGKVGRINLK